MEEKKRKEDLKRRDYGKELDNLILKEFYLMPKTERDEVILLLIYEKISNIVKSQLDDFIKDFTKTC